MKPHQSKITYLCPSPGGYRPADELIWRAPMRLTRQVPGAANTVAALTYGRYFEAITEVVSRDEYLPLVEAASRQLASDISLGDIDQIRIYVEKHGSDYHPARIEVASDEGCAVFVMNVAVTPRGKVRLSSEYGVLNRLNAKYGLPFLPQTYFKAEADNETSPEGAAGMSIIMFLADWFNGHHEFHLSIDESDGSTGLVVWDTEKTPFRLSRTQASHVYGQAAEIMTLYYDIETFEQIFPWHHAAGDFVVRPRRAPAAPEGDGGDHETRAIDVRLVTARQYAPMLDPSAGVSPHEALLFFLLNLSVRMRLDRLDGTGEVAWAGDHCVDATIEGFLDGLLTKGRKGMARADIAATFLKYCSSLSEDDLSLRLHALIDACDQAAPDIPVARDNLATHCSHLFSVLRAASAC